MKIVAIIQARLDSKRLPGKVLKDIAGKPLLYHVASRVAKAKLVSRVVVATSDETSDNPIVDLCRKYAFPFFKGSKDDVLDRHYQTAKLFGADVIVRITGDSPLIDPNIVDETVKYYLDNIQEYDYVSNAIPPTFPDGLDVEVFSFVALEKAWRDSTQKYEREHVTPFIIGSNEFRKGSYQNQRDYSHYRWCVDQEEDLTFVTKVFEHLYFDENIFEMDKIITLLEQEPYLLKINNMIDRNEGFVKSLVAENIPVDKFKTHFGSKLNSESVNKSFILEDKQMAETNNYILGNSINIEKSLELWNLGEKLIPGGTQTASKGPDQFVHGAYPIYIRSGKGSHVFDVDGNEYIDYPCSLGTNILGHSYPKVVEAIHRQANEGISFSLLHPLEVEVAEIITQEVPCAESVRFVKNGSDATSAAIRIARAYTNKEKIVSCGYHGWHDWYVISTEKTKGVPKTMQDYIFKFPYNDLEALRKIFNENQGQIAAVIMEPIIMDHPEEGFLNKVKEIAHENGALLIFDEVVTGFRFGLGGAQKYFNVIPDLATFGKCIANGMPLSLVTGKKEIMDQCHEIFLSLTFGGETVSLAAAKATLMEFREKNVVEHLWDVGKKLQDGLQSLINEYGIKAKTVGQAPRQNIVFENDGKFSAAQIKSYFLQETIKRGILIGNVILLTYSHTDKDIDDTLIACKEAFRLLKEAINKGDLIEKMEGKVKGEVFRQKAE